MKTLSVAEAVEDFGSVLVSLENEQEEILLVRGDHAVARLVPEPEPQDARTVLEDLSGILDDDLADDLLKGIAEGRATPNGFIDRLRNPWDS